MEGSKGEHWIKWQQSEIPNKVESFYNISEYFTFLIKLRKAGDIAVDKWKWETINENETENFHRI